MGEKIISICKDGVRHDISLAKDWSEAARQASAEARAKLRGMNDQQLIDHVKNKENTKDEGYFIHAKNEVSNRGLQGKFPEHFPAHSYAKSDTEISQGAIVTLRGHKGKVLLVEGDQANVSWEDASISKVPIKDLAYEGRVEKGGPGSGRFSDEVSSHQVKLTAARHLRRQGILGRKKI